MCYESYLDEVPSKFRIVFAKFRMASHQLRIVTGRYGVNRIERNQRLCNMCNSGEIEDEYHFLIICNAYKDIRVKYINKYYYTKPSVMKFIQ